MSAYRLARGVRLRVVENETPVLLVPEGIVELNDTAAETLSLVDGTRDAGAIAHALAEKYEAPPGEVAEDVRALLADFAERGFLATSDA